MLPSDVPTLEEIHVACEQGEAAVLALFTRMMAAYGQYIETLETRLQTLETQQKKNSQNSSKPPSSDGVKKPSPKSQRERRGKRSGGQRGHRGYRLEPATTPDRWVVHTVTACERCQMDLSDVVVQDVVKRQVFDLPVVRLEVTEHHADIKTCPGCGHTTQAAFPEAVRQPTQYGPRFRAQLVYFHSGQFLPLARTAEMVAGLYGQPVSEATVVNAVKEAAQRVAPVNMAVKTYLITTETPVHCDETGARVAGKLHWIHSASTPQATLYGLHPKRGGQGIDALGVLPQRQGWCVHDGWAPYFDYPGHHALCNAHHLRELTFIHEQYHHAWAADLRHQLVQMKQAADAARAANRPCLWLDQLAYFKDRYTVLLAQAAQSLGPPPKTTGKRRPKRSPAQNLLRRLQLRRDQVLAFITDLTVPFDNNLAERDIRLVKIQQKVSSGFRTLIGGDSFCAIRSYLSTARKNGQAALTALNSLFLGSPFFPSWLTTAE